MRGEKTQETKWGHHALLFPSLGPSAVVGLLFLHTYTVIVVVVQFVVLKTPLLR